MQKSDSINELAGAFAKARAEFKPVRKESVNPFFKSKYADLSVIIEATYEALAKNGLSVMQFPGEVNGGQVKVLTMLCHASGQWVSEETTMPVAKADAQGIGSALTYGRRYALQSVLNVAAEADDDGNAAVSNKPNGGTYAPDVLSERLEWIANAKDAKELHKLYTDAYRMFESAPVALKQLIAAKDAKKADFHA
jgi:hypothetical protein